jgi:trehalose 6-phosphate synthase
MFAEHVLDEIDGRPAAVFTQDYHLALLPRMLRNADPEILTGQFWHIPWPNHEIFRICPWQDELLDGLLANDLLGFHIGDHCDNFLETVARANLGRVNFEYNMVSHGDYLTLVRPFPISVDFEQINSDAQRAEVDDAIQRFTQEWNLQGKLVGLGIDRIDYTKGIPHRFRAMGRFFEKYPEYIGKVVFVQAGVMSRTNIEAYPTFRADRVFAGRDQRTVRQGRLATHHLYAHRSLQRNAFGAAPYCPVLRGQFAPRWHESGGEGIRGEQV